MQLSKNFTLQELIKSQTAIRLNINNTPTQQDIVCLKALCENILQRIRDRFKKPLTVSSGYRSAELCKAVGSSPKSQHAKGQAADIECLGVDNKVLAEWIKNNLKYDQLILEFYKESEGPQSGWIHVSYNPDKLRNQPLKAYKENGKTRYVVWL